MGLIEAYKFLSEEKIRHIVMVDFTGNITGVVTQADLIGGLDPEFFLEIRNVSDAMSREVVTVGPDDGLKSTIALMADNRISCVIVVEDNEPVGIFTERDVVDLAEKGSAVDGVRIGDVMTSPVSSIGKDISLIEAVGVMTFKKVRRIVVLDDNNHVEGILTQFDVLKGLESQYVKSLKLIVSQTERKLKDVVDELHEKKTYLDSILNSATDNGIITADLDMRINYFNPVAEVLLGISADKSIGQTVYDIHEKLGVDNERLVPALENVWSEGAHSFSIVKDTDGGPQHLEVRVSAIKEGDGTMIGYAFFCKDDTARWKAEQALKVAEHEKAIILDSMTETVTFHDRDLKIIWANKAAGKDVGKSAEELVGTYCYKVRHNEDDPCEECPVERVWETGAFQAQEVMSKTGKVSSVRAYPVYDLKGDIEGVVELAYDITERNKLRTERENLITDLQEALANIKTLKGLIPICAYCKKVRDDKGYWNRVESYIQQNSEAEFTHGICGECSKALVEDDNFKG